mmetsp:Transcript_3095/g.4759  ORF Transcript_3095/g.4759 Transcript_3095/m.4759 type:complete len:141 (+) Transcript_3095:1374-1796(+)
MPMNAVNAPAAPAYVIITSLSQPICVFVMLSWFHLLDKAFPTNPPAHTMGASGPTLKPNVEVTNDNRSKLDSAGINFVGKILISASLPDNALTKSATTKDGFNLMDNMPIMSPPMEHVMGMYQWPTELSSMPRFCKYFGR